VEADRVIDAERAAWLESRLRSVLGSRVRSDIAERALYASDASNYRVVPAMVATPANVDELATIAALCGEAGMPLTMRGAGTSIAGNALGSGVLVSTRSLARIIAIDPEAQAAVVEPGVVLDDLNRVAAAHGLRLGPDPSTHSRCTLGGMIGNDACGAHSVRWGTTAQSVLSLDVIRSDGTTVLGGDDKSGVAVIVEVLRALREEGVPHGDLEVVFTICEEVGLLGAKHLDYGRLRAREGISLDSDGPEEIIAEAPAACRLEFRVHGLAAHAGVRPEAGISAIRIAGEAIARMRLGRLDQESTANIGVIEGGKATNIITDFVLVKGEARSHDERKLARQVAHMQRRFQHSARRHRVERDGQVIAGRVEETVSRDYPRLRLTPDLRIVRLIAEAGRRLGREIGVRRTGGGLDANIFNDRGITVATFGTGQHEIHTLNEYLNVPESLRAAELMLECIRLNAA